MPIIVSLWHVDFVTGAHSQRYDMEKEKACMTEVTCDLHECGVG